MAKPFRPPTANAHFGKIVGPELRVFPKLPMSKKEALVIVTTMQPGALFMLDQAGKKDWPALRAVEVLQQRG